MPSEKARKLYDATEGAAKKHMEKISELPAEKPIIDWEAYSKLIKSHSDIIHEFKAKYNHLVAHPGDCEDKAKEIENKTIIPYPDDSDNRMGAAEAKDMEIKEIRDLVLEDVRTRTEQFNKERTFFRRLPGARSMTEEMYMEAFPRRAEVKPREREKLESEIEVANHELDVFEKKREERKKYGTPLVRITHVG